MRAVLFVVVTAAIGGCGSQVDCAALCQHTLACEVTFATSDDPDGSRIASGERTDVEDCRAGCEENPVVTVESAQCVDAETAKSTDPDVCQKPVLHCFGL
jgi:hypothetical protein